uniref:G_PROTEIN_RECEP_F1_2 domain-containing protein n=1 Tax=Parastrongyloides trichosuri TaxID=131310 RepID=A0A0N4ZWC1_PARTI
MLGVLDYVILSLYGFMTLLGVIGNVGVMIVIFLDKKLHEPTSMMILNLAIADLFFVVICIPPTSINLIGAYELSNGFCRFQMFFSYLSVFVSSYTLVLLAIDRFTAVVLPIFIRPYKNITNTLLACAGTWGLCTLICNLVLPTPGLLYSPKGETTNYTHVFCMDNPKIADLSETKSNVHTFYYSFIIFSYILPLTIIVILYSLMLYTYRKTTVRKTTVNRENIESRKKRITTTVWLVVATFSICWFPQNIRFFLLAFYYPLNAPYEKHLDGFDYRIILLVFQTMAYANSCMNPIIYCFMLKRYRDPLKHFWFYVQKIFCCREFALHELNDMTTASAKFSVDGSIELSVRSLNNIQSTALLSSPKENMVQMTSVYRTSTEDIDVSPL